MVAFPLGRHDEQYFTSYKWASLVLLGFGLNSTDTRKLTGIGVSKEQTTYLPNSVSNIQPRWNCLKIVN